MRSFGYISGAIAIGILIAMGGCGGGSKLTRPGPPEVAVLPFEGLAGGVETARIITVLCQSYVIDHEQVNLLDPGRVEDALATNRIRRPSLMTSEQRQALRNDTGAELALAGALLSFGTTQHPYAGKVAIVSFTARVIRLEDGAIVWADTRSKQGSDSQWLFGLGTQHDPSVLASKMCKDLIHDIPWMELER